VSDRGFVPLKSLAGKGPKTTPEILQEIRDIYFRTTRQTIQHDLAHAIELLKSLPDEETREKATVYMEGLAQMRREWRAAASAKVKGQRAKGKGKGKK
jgi:hypothetical protein